MSQELPDEWEITFRHPDRSTQVVTLTNYEPITRDQAVSVAQEMFPESVLTVVSAIRKFEAGAPRVEHKPHSRYSDWPGKTEITFEQGHASLENMYDGAHLFVYVGGSHETVACLTLEESKLLHEQLGIAIVEQEELVKKYAE